MAAEIFKRLKVPLVKKLKFVLKDTSVRARDTARRRVARAFKVRSGSTLRWLQYGVKSTRSVTSKLEAAIWLHAPSSKQSRGFLADHETGGTFRAKKSKTLAVPTKIPGRTGRGRIRGSQKPKALIKKMNSGNNNKRVRYFTSKGKLYKQTSKKVRGRRKKRIQSRKIQLMYTFSKSVKKAARFGYYAAIKKMIDKTFNAALDRELTETMTRYFNKLGAAR